MFYLHCNVPLTRGSSATAEIVVNISQAHHSSFFRLQARLYCQTWWLVPVFLACNSHTHRDKQTFIGTCCLFCRHFQRVFDCCVEITFLCHWWSGSDCTVRLEKESDLAMIGKEHIIALMNHKYDIDWLMAWILAERLQMLGVTTDSRLCNLCSSTVC